MRKRIGENEEGSGERTENGARDQTAEKVRGLGADPGRGQRAESVPDAEGLEGGGVVAGEGGAAVAKVDAVDRGQGATTATVATGTRRVRGRPVLSAAAVA